VLHTKISKTGIPNHQVVKDIALLFCKDLNTKEKEKWEYSFSADEEKL
jgi:hypothetical protein